MKNYVNLAAFRKRNHLKQQDIADFLGVTRSFVSLVETGKAKLTDYAVHRLYIESEWDPADLVPEYKRFVDIWRDYVESIGGELPIWPLEDDNPFGIHDCVIQDLFYGNIGLSDKIADEVMKLVPNLNREWFLSGEGPRYLTKQKTPIGLLEEILEKIEILNTKLCDVDAKLRTIESKLGS